MMQQPKLAADARLIESAERVLHDTYGIPLRLEQEDNLQNGLRALVYRFQVRAQHEDMTLALPQSVIVKQAKGGWEQPYSDEQSEIPAWANTTLNEWASLQFLKAVRFAMAPRLYGGDLEHGLLVLEDLGSGQGLNAYLLGNDALAAEHALIEYARQQGGMHTATALWTRDYQHRRAALGPVEERGPGHGDRQRLITTFQQSAELFGVAVSSQVLSELEAVFTTLFTPGPFHTFIQIDACQDNCLFTENGCYLIDFEGGETGHALLSGVYGHVRFPTCWCVFDIPQPIIQKMDDVYRAELSKGCFEAMDDTLFSHALVEASVYWMLWRNTFIPLPRLLDADRNVIAASDRQRHIMNMDVVASTTDEYSYLPHTGAVAREIARKMRERWPEQSNIPYYPAFR